MNKKEQKILKKIQAGEKWLAFPTTEYLQQVFQPKQFLRKYVGFDDDKYLSILQQKWKRLGLSEKGQKGKLEFIFETIKLWISDHPAQNANTRGLATIIRKDLHLSTPTIQLCLRIIKSKKISFDSDIYSKIFTSNEYFRRKKK